MPRPLFVSPELLLQVVIAACGGCCTWPWQHWPPVSPSRRHWARGAKSAHRSARRPGQHQQAANLDRRWLKSDISHVRNCRSCRTAVISTHRCNAAPSLPQTRRPPPPTHTHTHTHLSPRRVHSMCVCAMCACVVHVHTCKHVLFR